VACVISFLMTGHRSVYPSQVLSLTKSSSLAVAHGKEMRNIGAVEYQPHQKSISAFLLKGVKRVMKKDGHA
jgi:hypothetical protein